MNLKLYAHPFSSYSQKVLIPLYENDTPFELCMLGPDQPQNSAELERLWPFKRFPVLEDRGRTVMESSIIIEYLGIHYPGPVRLLPTDAAAALEVRFMDRFFDLYVHAPMQKLVFDRLRGPEAHDKQGVEEARRTLDIAYRWLESALKGRVWSTGAEFTLADCSAAPALFYADWCHAISEEFPNVRAYRQRLLARPSFARAVAEARPYRAWFPLGAPDRD
jgi:glutathione S-transferase